MDGIDEVENISDPAERAREVGRRMAEIPAWHARMAGIRRAAVIEMKDQQGMTFSEIGRVLDLHRNRVQQIYEGRSGGRRVHRAADNAAEPGS